MEFEKIDKAIWEVIVPVAIFLILFVKYVLPVLLK